MTNFASFDMPPVPADACAIVAMCVVPIVGFLAFGFLLGTASRMLAKRRPAAEIRRALQRVCASEVLPQR